MIAAARALSTNRAGWDRVAPMFYGRTALPEYGPLAPTEDALRLLDDNTDRCALELGCGSGHSLRYLAERGARELWGLDLSPVQIAFAQETLRPFAARVRLIESPMEVDPGIPQGHFDLVFSIYGLGWTTNLRATMELVARYLRAGGAFLVSGEHPAYGCLGWNGTQYTVSDPYCAEGPREHTSWKGVPIVIQRRTLGTLVGQIVQAGLQIEALVETPLNPALATEVHADPARWYSVARASMMPTTFIIKARKPSRKPMSRLLRFPSSVKRDPAIEVWMREHSGELGAIARRWFEAMRNCGDDVRELLHDGHPTACVGDAAFGYVNAFTRHVNVGFFRGAEIVDPEGLLQGTGKFMRHVKLGPEREVGGTALMKLIETAYTDMKGRLSGE